MLHWSGSCFRHGCVRVAWIRTSWRPCNANDPRTPVATIALGGRDRFAAAQDGTSASPADEVMPFGSDTFAFLGSGYVSLIFVTSEDAIDAETDQPVKFVIYSHDRADHATGGAVFADTATFISHLNAVDKFAALNDQRTPVPTPDHSVRRFHVARARWDDRRVLLHRPEPLGQQRRAAAPGNSPLFALDLIPGNGVLFRARSFRGAGRWRTVPVCASYPPGAVVTPNPSPVNSRPRLVRSAASPSTMRTWIIGLVSPGCRCGAIGGTAGMRASPFHWLYQTMFSHVNSPKSPTDALCVRTPTPVEPRTLLRRVSRPHRTFDGICRANRAS